MLTTYPPRRQHKSIEIGAIRMAPLLMNFVWDDREATEEDIVRDIQSKCCCCAPGDVRGIRFREVNVPGIGEVRVADCWIVVYA